MDPWVAARTISIVAIRQCGPIALSLDGKKVISG
jgi:hypothetical protein